MFVLSSCLVGTADLSAIAPTTSFKHGANSTIVVLLEIGREVTDAGGEFDGVVVQPLPQDRRQQDKHLREHYLPDYPGQANALRPLLVTTSAERVAAVLVEDDASAIHRKVIGSSILLGVD